MEEERPQRFTSEPMSYATAGKQLVDSGNKLVSFEEILRGITLFLSSRSSRFQAARSLVRSAISDHGIWGYTNVYWTGDSFSLKDDTFGLGQNLDSFIQGSETKSPVLPSNPKGVYRFDNKMFGVFKPSKFVEGRPGEFFRENSKGLSELASRNGLDIEVKGLKIPKGELKRTVCSLRFRQGVMILDLADDETNRRYALGRRGSHYDPSRFS